jgi:hypothetical protein
MPKGHVSPRFASLAHPLGRIVDLRICLAGDTLLRRHRGKRPTGSDRMIVHFSTTRVPLLLGKMEACAAIPRTLWQDSARANRQSACRKPAHSTRDGGSVEALVRSRRRKAPLGRRDLLEPRTGPLRDRWRKDQPSQLTSLTALSMHGHHQQRNGRLSLGRPRREGVSPNAESKRTPASNDTGRARLFPRLKDIPPLSVDHTSADR